MRDGSVELFKVKGEENPADLFTKHLTSRDRIRSLLNLFGCKYMDGRAAAAPVLRSGAGTSKGELLELVKQGAETMPWHGRTFPKAEVGAGEPDVPEALSCSEGLLPHLHSDVRDRFPQAVACAELDACDPPEDRDMEERGTMLGKKTGEADARQYSVGD